MAVKGVGGCDFPETQRSAQLGALAPSLEELLGRAKEVRGFGLERTRQPEEVQQGGVSFPPFDPAYETTPARTRLRIAAARTVGAERSPTYAPATKRVCSDRLRACRRRCGATYPTSIGMKPK